MENSNFKYAGFWIRTVAHIIDTVLLIVLVSALMFVISGGSLETLAAGESYGAMMIVQLLPIVIIIGMWTKFQATPGKMMLGLKIVDAETGGELGLGKSILRYLAYIVSAIPLMLGYFWVGWDKRKQGFHDKISSTVVVSTK